MERCPGCRARMGDDPVCARCGCDLVLVRRAETLAAHLMRSAMSAWAKGDRIRATTQMQASLALEHHPLGDFLLECVSSSDTTLSSENTYHE